MRQIFSISLLVIGISFIALSIVYFLYGPIQHQRYWNVTDRLVKENQALYHAAALQTMAVKLSKNGLLDIDDLASAIIPTSDRHMAIDVFTKNELALRHRRPDRELFIADFKVIEVGAFSIHYHIYKPPTWHSRFTRWLKPTSWSSWFTNQWDYITLPFLTIVILLFAGALLVALIAQTRFLEFEIGNRLLDIEKRQKEFLDD